MKTLPGRTVWHGEGLRAVGLSGMLRGSESPLTGAPSANVRRTSQAGGIRAGWWERLEGEGLCAGLGRSCRRRHFGVPHSALC